jgi:hypothetical protein
MRTNGALSPLSWKRRPERLNDLAGCPRFWVPHEQLLNCDAAGNHHTSRQHGWAISTLLLLRRQLGDLLALE